MVTTSGKKVTFKSEHSVLKAESEIVHVNIEQQLDEQQMRIIGPSRHAGVLRNHGDSHNDGER
jgi:hypothetical protein